MFRAETDVTVGLDATGELTLWLRRPQAAAERCIVVLDADSGEPLPAALAYTSHDEVDEMLAAREAEHRIPDAATLARPAVRAGPDGRIVIDQATKATLCYVVAPGRSWRAVSVGRGAPHSQEVRLGPGGALRLMVSRWSELVSPTVDLDADPPDEVDDDEAGPEADSAIAMRLPQPDADGRLLIEGLMPGRHEVVVRRGEWSDEGVEYGRCEFEILAGGTTDVVVESEPGAPRSRVRVTGSIRLRGVWDETPSSVTIDGVDLGVAEFHESVDVRLPSGGTLVEFAFDRVPEGRHRIVLHPIGWCRTLVVGPGPTHVDLEVEESAEVTVRVRDAVTKGPVPGARTEWLVDDHDMACNKVRKRPDGSHVLHAPSGVLLISAWASGYARADREVTVASGGNAVVEIDLVRSGTVVVRLQSEGKPFQSGDPQVELFSTDDSDSLFTLSSMQASHGVATFPDVAPGAWIVGIGGGWKGWTCEPQEVQVTSGREVTITLTMVRAK